MHHTDKQRPTISGLQHSDGAAPKPKIPLARPVFTKEMEDAAVKTLWNEHFVGGESVHKFEEEFAEYCGTDYAVSMNSGTDALQIALEALGVGRKQEVITTPASFVATSNVAVQVGAIPVFADIDLKTYTLAPEKVKQALTRRTKAVILVHLYGYPADIDSINEALSGQRISVVEDACQAHGATYKGRKTGNLGDVACFSFYPSKNMTVGGDGGMLTTNEKRVAAKAAKLRNCGRRSKYIHDLIGYTARLNTVNAAIGRVQLKYLDEWNEKRIQNAETYDRLLSDVEHLVLPPKGNGRIRPVYHLYTLRTRSRDKLAEWLESNGIQCGINYELPIHLQPIYKKMFGFKRGMYPASEELCKTCLSIPMYPDLSRDEINFISETIHSFFERTK